MNIAIIGGGTSGIFSSLMIRKMSSHEVYLFDGNQKIGRKLFATGNGRCNITNLNASASAYFSRKKVDITSVFERWTPEKVRELLLELGIPTEATADGWVYPCSYSAANVVQILSDDLLFSGVKVFSGRRITQIKYDAPFFHCISETETDSVDFDQIILASGSRAFPQLGANTSILSELFQFGHRDIPFSPALCPVNVEGSILRTLKPLLGVRVDANIALYHEKELLGKTMGNVIFTDYGINGPGVMNISHLIDQIKPEGFQIDMDFLVGDMAKNIEELFYRKINSGYMYRSIFLAYLPEKLVELFFKIWKLDWDTPCRRVDSRAFRSHEKKLQTFGVPVTGGRGFNFGQAAAGGIPLDEVSLSTMMSKKQNGLYFAGEALDVVGPCGGYNLHWAIASGCIAGEAAGKAK